MALPNPTLVAALRATADRLERTETRYEWGHMARCNCGHLARTLTGLDETALQSAVRHEMTEWSEHARDYCPADGGEVPAILHALESAGFGPSDVRALEHLSDPDVLARLPEARRRSLRRNQRDDVVLYCRTLADLLATRIPPAAMPSATAGAAKPPIVC